MHKKYTFDADNKPILYVDPRDQEDEEMDAEEMEEVEKRDEGEEPDDAEILERASDSLMRIMEWEMQPVAEVRMTLKNLILAKRAFFLLNTRPGILGLEDVSLSGLARLTGIPKQKLATLNNSFKTHFQQPSLHSKKKQASKQPRLVLPPIDHTIQLDLLTGEAIKD